MLPLPPPLADLRQAEEEEEVNIEFDGVDPAGEQSHTDPKPQEETAGGAGMPVQQTDQVPSKKCAGNTPLPSSQSSTAGGTVRNVHTDQSRPNPANAADERER